MIYLQQACFLSCLGWQRKARVTFQALRIGKGGWSVATLQEHWLGLCHPALCEQTASFSSVLAAIHPALCGSPASVSAGRGLPSALPTGCFPNPCHSTHKHIHTRSASLTHRATRTHEHVPSFMLTVLSSWLLQAHGTFLERRSWSSRVGLFWFFSLQL